PRPDPSARAVAELGELAARAATLREATEVTTPGPGEAARLVPLARRAARDLQVVARRLDDRAAEAPAPPGAPTCARCGRALLDDGWPRRWCSHACRQRAYEARRAGAKR
ncbi:MAG: hypothetical protein ACRDZQ_15405, partial [Acidimicrobiales bacterium]